STTSRTTSAPSSTQSTTSTKERKLCGPALIVGLALIPVLVKRR
ncbi:CGP-CTERM sorting domain-containing protein, partial [Thermococcus sp.]